MRFIRSTCFAVLATWAAVSGAISDARAESPDDPPARVAQDDPDAIANWVAQLNSDQYHRREMATQQLIKAGPEAIDALLNVLGSGELELVERATAVMTEIALAQPPAEDGGAWEKLSALATDSTGRTASRAQTAVQEIRDHRAVQARTKLTAAGIFVGIDEFMIRSISGPAMMIQIDEKWQGDLRSLQWLQWLEGVENVLVKGPAVTRQVLQQVAKVPNLQKLAIVDANIGDDTLDPLLDMEPLLALELRYVPLKDQQGDKIAAIPIRMSLNLMGTGISAEKVDAMRAATPGLQIDHRQGGFLGVKCLDGLGICEISDVVDESAAAEAGLRSGDVIVQIEDTEVSRFKDLQDAINKRVPGDQISVKFRRGGTEETVQVELRRLEQP